jgi:hypothetical protein
VPDEQSPRHVQDQVVRRVRISGRDVLDQLHGLASNELLAFGHDTRDGRGSPDDTHGVASHDAPPPRDAHHARSRATEAESVNEDRTRSLSPVVLRRSEAKLGKLGVGAKEVAQRRPMTGPQGQHRGNAPERGGDTLCVTDGGLDRTYGRRPDRVAEQLCDRVRLSSVVGARAGAVGADRVQ